MSALAQAPAWSPAQVQDTLHRLVARPAYQRDVAESLLDRLMSAFWELLGDLIRAVAYAAGSRQLVYAVLIGLAVVLVVRLALDLRSELLARSRTKPLRATARVRDPWSEAERLAAAGAYTDAAHALLRALLAALSARGEVRLHSSKTAGDYARELRRRNAVAAPTFQRFRVRYDRAIYGDRVVSDAEYRALLDDARPVLTSGPPA